MLFAKSVLCFILTTAPTFVFGAAGDFTYDSASDVGPAKWKDIVYADGTDNQCGGTSNSPIAIAEASCDVFEDYTFSGGNCRLQDFSFSINHHAEQVNAPTSDVCEAHSVNIPGVEGEFEMLQFHIHTNSEHTFNGDRFGGEFHIVHKEVGGERLAVVGLFLTPTALEPNDVFSHILSEFDKISDETYEDCNKTALTHWWQVSASDQLADFPADDLNAYDLIPEGSSFYNYDGGLTTPPCSEIVEWSVVDKPVEVTLAQYTDLTKLILNYVSKDTCEFATIADPESGSTSRPVQDLGERVVKRICPVGFVDELAGTDSEATSTGATSSSMISGFSMAIAAIAAALSLSLA